MEEKIEIIINTIDDDRAGFAKQVLYQERQVFIDGNLAYSDRLSPNLILSATDPLSELHNWLNNTGRYRRKVRTCRKYSFYRRLVAFFQSLPLRLKVLALRLKKFYLQKKVLFIKSFRFGC